MFVKAVGGNVKATGKSKTAFHMDGLDRMRWFLSTDFAACFASEILRTHLRSFINGAVVGHLRGEFGAPAGSCIA